MPLAQIALREGKNDAYRRALGKGVYTALVLDRRPLRSPTSRA